MDFCAFSAWLMISDGLLFFAVSFLMVNKRVLLVGGDLVKYFIERFMSH